MNEAWFRVAGTAFSCLAAGAAGLVVLLAFLQDHRERAHWRRLMKDQPEIGAACVFRVTASETRRLTVGRELRVPDEGTLGAAGSCDVCIPYRKVHLRSAFFWMEKDGLHMVPLHRDGFLVDGVRAEPGDEAVLQNGAVLKLGDLCLTLKMGRPGVFAADGPYVTRARRERAGTGHGDGVGAPGRFARKRLEASLKDPEDPKNDRKGKRNGELEQKAGQEGRKKKGKAAKAGAVAGAAGSQADGHPAAGKASGAGRKDKRLRGADRPHHGLF